MITKKENIISVFSAFHDGEIRFCTKEKSTQVWEIDCQYLAEIVNTRYVCFWVKIYNCSLLQFNPWIIPIESPKEVWIETKDIFKTGLEIISVKEKNGKIEISCSQHNSTFNFCGGELSLDCRGIEIFDQEWNKIEFEELDRICSNYWNK